MMAVVCDPLTRLGHLAGGLIRHERRIHERGGLARHPTLIREVGIRYAEEVHCPLGIGLRVRRRDRVLVHLRVRE